MKNVPTTRCLLNRLIVAFSALVCLFCAVLLNSPRPAYGGEGVKIAAIFSLSGIAASQNSPMVKMVEFTVNSINQNGGILGKKIDLVILDNKSSPIGSAQAAQEAVKMDVTAVIGGHYSSHSLAMAPILQDAGIPMITPASTNPAITQNRDFVFRACFIDSLQGKAMAHFAREKLNAKRAAIVTNVDEEYSSTLATFFQESFVDTGGEVVAEVHYRADAMDFLTAITEIQRHIPDIIYIPGYSRESGLFIKQARKLGVEAVFLGGDAWSDIASFAGEAINGSYQTTAWHPMVPYPASLRLKKEYRKAYKSEIMNFNSPLAYDAVMILKKAMEKCNCFVKDSIRDNLLEVNSLPCSTGSISFDSQGDPQGKKIIIVQFQNNKPIYVEAVRP